MTVPVGDIVDLDSLWQTIVAAMVAGVGITVVFSLAVLGFARADQARLEGRIATASGWTLLALFGLAAAAGGVVLGLIVMTEK